MSLDCRLGGYGSWFENAGTRCAREGAHRVALNVTSIQNVEIVFSRSAASGDGKRYMWDPVMSNSTTI